MNKDEEIIKLAFSIVIITGSLGFVLTMAFNNPNWLSLSMISVIILFLVLIWAEPM